MIAQVTDFQKLVLLYIVALSFLYVKCPVFPQITKFL